MIAASTSKLWKTAIEVTFQADDVEEAEQMAEEIAAETLSHRAVWRADGYFEPKQTTETVDV